MHLRAAFSDDLKTWTSSVEVNVKKESPPKAIWAPVLHLHPSSKPGEPDMLWQGPADIARHVTFIEPQGASHDELRMDFENSCLE